MFGDVMLCDGAFPFNSLMRGNETLTVDLLGPLGQLLVFCVQRNSTCWPDRRRLLSGHKPEQRGGLLASAWSHDDANTRLNMIMWGFVVEFRPSLRPGVHLFV
jgi:hypothetical protein